MYDLQRGREVLYLVLFATISFLETRDDSFIILESGGV